MASFTLDYSLEGSGWAIATINNRLDEVKMPVSFLHDSLQELASSAIALYKGAKRGKIRFFAEPGCYYLIFEQHSQKPIQYEVRWYADQGNWNDQPIGEYSVQIAGETHLNRVTGEVLKILQDIFDKYGMEEYKELWKNHEFPIDELQKLKRLKKLKT